MKYKARTTQILATLCTSIAFAAGPAAKLDRETAAYRFESEPSQPLGKFGAPTRDPKLTLRASGSVYLLTVSGPHSGSKLGVAISSDGGDSFAPPAVISRPEGKVSSHGENSPSFSFGNGIEVYALWEESTAQGLGTNLLVARSPAFGHSWLPPVKITDKTKPSTNAFSSMTVASNGDIYAVWLDGRDREMGPPGTSSVYLAKSTDRGKTFGGNVAVAHGVCPCCRPTAIADARGTVHVSWRHVYPGNLRDMAVATSRDGGETFGQPVRVAHDKWKINGCPHAGASMVQKGNRLWMSWYSDGDGSNAGVRLAYSDDAAQSFSKPVLVSRGILDANHPSLAFADDGRLLLAFQGRDPEKNDGWSPAGPYLIEISDAGHASAPIQVPGHKSSISYPTVAGGSLGRVFVAWTEKGKDGQQQIRLSRGRRVSRAPSSAPSNGE
jgi:hypothetical protein